MKDVILFVLGAWGLLVVVVVFAACGMAADYDRSMGYK